MPSPWRAERTFGSLGAVAVVTDHQAMATAQRRHSSGFGGFSSAFGLNEFFLRFQAMAPHLRRDVFFVAGVRNPADGPSRANRIRDGLSAVEVATQLPALATCWHPHLLPERRERWMW